MGSFLEQQTVPTPQPDSSAPPARPRHLPGRLTIVQPLVVDVAAAWASTSCCCISFDFKRLLRVRDFPQHSLHVLHEFNTASTRRQRPHLDDKLQLLRLQPQLTRDNRTERIGTRPVSLISTLLLNITTRFLLDHQLPLTHSSNSFRSKSKLRHRDSEILYLHSMKQDSIHVDSAIGNRDLELMISLNSMARREKALDPYRAQK